MSAFLQLSSSLCPSGLPGASSGGGLPPIQPASSPAWVLGSLLVSVSSLKRAPRGSRSGTDGVSFLFSWGACEMGTTPLQNAHIQGLRASALPGVQAPPLSACLPPGPRAAAGAARPKPLGGGPRPLRPEPGRRPRVPAPQYASYALCPNSQPRIPRTDPQKTQPQGPPGRLLAHRAWRPPRCGMP